MMFGLSNLRDFAWIRREIWRMFKYGIVGGISTGIFFGGYLLLSRVLLPTWNKTLLDAIAISISGIFNFTMHRIWTFQAQNANAKMVARYLATVGTASLLQVIIFYIGNHVFGFTDYYVQIFAFPFLAFFQYVLHRSFTFHPRFDRVRSEAVVIDAADVETGSRVHVEAIDINQMDN
jgi:putative flippase GtrA